MVPHVTIPKTGRVVVVGVLVTFGLSIGDPRAGAEPAPLPARMQPVQVDSGLLQNRGAEPAVLFSQVVDLGPDVPWLRVLFDKETTLAPGSYIRVTSLLDGETQILDAEQLDHWGYGTAFFNGSAIEVVLIGAGSTARNAVRIGEVFAGEAVLPPAIVAQIGGEPTEGGGGVAAICGGADGRAPAANPRVGRLIQGTKPAPGGGICTAFIIDTPPGEDKLHLTAGHCFGNVDQRLSQRLAVAWILQFNVPGSAATCAIVHPGIPDQFVVRGDDVISVFPDANGDGVKDGLPGNDWAVFRCHPNQRTGLTTFQHAGRNAYGLGVLPDPGAAPGVPVIVVGYGVDGGIAPNDCGGSSNVAFIGPGPNGVINTPLNNCPGGGNDAIVLRAGVPYVGTGGDLVMDTFLPGGNDDVCLWAGLGGCACGNVFLGPPVGPPSCIPNTADAVWNFTQQFHVAGAWRDPTEKRVPPVGGVNVRVRETTDNCGGNSGSPVIRLSDSRVVAIQTHAGCKGADATNFATAVDHPNLLGAIGHEKGKFPIPTVSEWGLGALALLLFSSIALKFGRRRSEVVSA